MGIPRRSIRTVDVYGTLYTIAWLIVENIAVNVAEQMRHFVSVEHATSNYAIEKTTTV